MVIFYKRLGIIPLCQNFLYNIDPLRHSPIFTLSFLLLNHYNRCHKESPPYILFAITTNDDFSVQIQDTMIRCLLPSCGSCPTTCTLIIIIPRLWENKTHNLSSLMLQSPLWKPTASLARRISCEAILSFLLLSPLAYLGTGKLEGRA